MKSYIVGPADEIAEGGRKVISCDGTEVGVFRVGGELVAWYNQCAHVGGPVCQGKIFHRVTEPVDGAGRTRMLQFDENEPNIVCPWHGWEFSLRTGCHPGNPNARLRRARLEEADGQVYVLV